MNMQQKPEIKSHSCSPQPRRPIRSDEMVPNSGNCRESPLSSQKLKYAKEATWAPDTNSDDDGDDDDTSTKVRVEVNVEVKVKDASHTDCGSFTDTRKGTMQNTNGSEQLQMAVLYGIIIALIGGCLCSFITQKTANIEVSTTEHEKEIQKEIQKKIQHIREEFPSQLENIWVAFSAGIKETALGTPTKPSVFMLLYDTEEGTPICLAQKIGNISTLFLDAVKSHPLFIEGADLEHNETLAEDYGILLEEYRLKVEEQRTVIVNNLHKIPGTVAQFFHSFCDTVTPAVDKAVYFFTMKASGVTSNRDNPTAVAEEELRKLWSDKLDEDVLNPLITRITDQTMIIKPEKNLEPCQI